MADELFQPMIGCLGFPVAGAATQFVLQQVMKRAELDWHVMTAEVVPEELAVAIEGARALRFSGLELLPPFEMAALPLFPEASARARQSGTVEVARRTSQGWEADDLRIDVLNRMINDRIEKSRGILLCLGEASESWATLSLDACHPVSWRWMSVTDPFPELIDPVVAMDRVSDGKLPGGEESTEEAPPVDPQAEEAIAPLIVVVAGKLSDQAWNILAEALESQAGIVILSEDPGGSRWRQQISRTSLKSIEATEYAAWMLQAKYRYWTGREEPLSWFRDALDEFLAF
ncbi:MAG: hypothetical protein ACKN9U_14550 [Pirellulaceae bacterium]